MQQQEQQEITSQEVDARIMALIAQRNRALDENVILGGQVSLLQQRVRELEKRIDDLTSFKSVVVEGRRESEVIQ